MATFLWIYIVNKKAHIGFLGSYFFDLSIINYLSIIAIQGLNNTSMRILPNLINLEKYGDVKFIYHLIVKRILLFSTVLVLITIFVIQIIDKDSIHAIGILSFAIPFHSIFLFNIIVLRILENKKLSEYLRILHIPLFLLLVSIIFWNTISQPYVIHFSFVMSSALGALYSSFLIYRYFLGSIQVECDNKIEITKNVFSLSKNFFKINLLNGLNESLAILLLGMYATNTLIGQYVVVKKIMKVPFFITESLSIYVSPIVSRLYYSENYLELKKTIDRYSLSAFVLNLPVLIVLLFFGEEMLFLFGNRSLDAIFLLHILVVGQLFNSFLGYNNIILSMTGNEKALLKIITIYVIVRSIGIFLVVELYGYIGIALITSILLGTRKVINLYYCQKKIGINAFFASIYFKYLFSK